MRPIALMGIAVSVLMLTAWNCASAQASTDGSFLANARNRLQGRVQHSAPNLKSFGKDFDSDKALKISQSAIGRSLADYHFRNRNGKPVRLAGFRGRPLVISLIYTSCFHICPATTQSLARAVKATRSAVGKDKFSIVTIGFDALHDTPKRMSGFARQQGVSSARHWNFLSADKATIARLAADIGFIFVPSPKGFDHLIQTTVLDKEGKVYRQIYGMDIDSSILTETMKELVFGLSPETLSLSALVSRVRLYCTVYDPASGTYKFNYAMLFGMATGALMLGVGGFFLFRFLRYS